MEVHETGKALSTFMRDGKNLHSVREYTTLQT